MDIGGRIDFTEEQGQLLEMAERFCREKSPIGLVRRLINSESGYEKQLWDEVADLGWLGIATPEQYGGVGLGLAEVVPVMEQMGRNLMAGPFLSTTLAGQMLLAGGTEAQKRSLLPALVSGKRAALALTEEDADWNPANIKARVIPTPDGLILEGTKFLVSDAAQSDFILTSVLCEGGVCLLILETSSLPEGALRRETIIDESKRSYQLSLDGISVAESAVMEKNKALTALEHTCLAATLLVAAEMVGANRAVIDYTVEYLQTRQQFGKLIGSYQALKHPIVDAHVMYEQARSHLYSAASCFGRQGEGEIAVRMAKATVGDSFAFAADRAIQFHGGFGFTYDCDAQLYRRRAIWSESNYGDALYHRQKLAQLLL